MDAATHPMEGDAVLAGLTPRQQVAVPIVLAAATLKAGLDTAGVPRSTWRRWLAEPTFRSGVAQLQREAFLESMDDLKAGVRFAVTVQLGLMMSKNENIRLAASRAVLEHAQRWAEVDDLGERLARIEQALDAVLGKSASS